MSTIHSQATKLSIDVPPSPAVVAPSERDGRVVGYDLARCLAFFGMVVVNYRFVMGGFRGSPEWLLATMDVFTLRAAATFVMLAGVGMTLLWRARRDAVHPKRWTNWLRTIAFVLMLAGAWVVVDFYVLESAAERAVQFGPLAGLERGVTPAADLAPLQTRFWDYGSALAEGAVSMFLKVGAGVCGALLLTLLILGRRGWGPRAVLLKRALFLAAVGFVWYPLWGGDILRFYAIYLFAGVFVLTLRWPWVIGCIVAILTAAFWWQFVESGGAPLEPFENVGNNWTLEAMGRELFVGGFHPVLPWLAFLFVGVLIGRINPGSWRAKGGLLALGLTLAVVGYAGAEPVMDRLRDEAGPKVERHVADRELLVAAKRPANEQAPAGAVGPDLPQPELPQPEQSQPEQPQPEQSQPGQSQPAEAQPTEAQPTEAQPTEAQPQDPQPAESPSADIPLILPEGFDRAANADFVAGAERLQKLLAAIGGFGSRSLRVADVQRGEPRRALVLTLSYGEGQAAPRDHEPQIERVRGMVQRWVRAERRARAAESGTAAEEPRWPAAVGLLAIERRLAVKPVTPEGPSEMVLWDTRWLDTAAMLDPSTGARWAGLMDPFGFTPGPGYMMTAMGVSLSVIALSLMLASFAMMRRILRPFVVAGQMALTLYVAHVVIGFYVLKRIDRLQGENLTFIAFYVVVCWLAAVAFANWWRAHWRRGPLESVMRWMTG